MLVRWYSTSPFSAARFGMLVPRTAENISGKSVRMSIRSLAMFEDSNRRGKMPYKDHRPIVHRPAVEFSCYEAAGAAAAAASPSGLAPSAGAAAVFGLPGLGSRRFL